jgi:hypothetical protein
MGGGVWDSGAYTSSKATRAATKTPDFAYTVSASSVHPNLEPKRINSKPFGKLEARDSDDHPNSHPVFVAFDVTGSNYERAVDAQQKLPNLMELLNKYVSDPQVAIAANDDFDPMVRLRGSHDGCLQVSDFESDIRVDEHIRNIWLTRNGGGNSGESYDLLLYVAARKVVLDSIEKRGKKGYFFMYADEPIFNQVKASEVSAVFGDTIQADIPIAEIIEEARRNFDIFVIWPTGGYDNARKQYVDLFGAESVLTLQHPNLICELIASTIGLYEDKATPASIVTDLVAYGVDHHTATALVKVSEHAVASSLATSGAGKAARL